MSFSYDTALGTARDRVRFYTTDTVQSGAIWTNEELDGLLAAWPDELRAAAYALRNRAVYFAARAISFSVRAGDNASFQVNRSNLPKFYLDLATNLEQQALATPGEYIDSVAFRVEAFGRDRSEYIGENLDLIDLLE